MSEHMSPIPSRIYNAAVGGHVCGPEDVDFGQKVVHLIKYDRAGNEVSFESQVTQANKIYVIHDDFVLNGNVTIPANCVLEFDGGSISGAYNLINLGKICNSADSVIFKGVLFSNPQKQYVKLAWFDYNSVGDSLLAAAKFQIVDAVGTWNLDKEVVINNDIELFGGIFNCRSGNNAYNITVESLDVSEVLSYNNTISKDSNSISIGIDGDYKYCLLQASNYYFKNNERNGIVGEMMTIDNLTTTSTNFGRCKTVCSYKENVTVKYFNAINANIHNCKFIANYGETETEGCLLKLTHCTGIIKDCYFTGCSTGIAITDSYSAKILSCNFEKIYPWAIGFGGATFNSIVDNCTFKKHRHAWTTLGEAYVAKFNTICNCNINDCLIPITSHANAFGTLIEGNHISDCGGGVGSFSPNCTTIGNVIENCNTDTAPSIYYIEAGPINAIVKNNVIINSKGIGIVSDFADCVYNIVPSTVIIESNTIKDAIDGSGIIYTPRFTNNDGGRIVINNNTIEAYGYKGILCEGKYVVISNNIVRNSQRGHEGINVKKPSNYTLSGSSATIKNNLLYSVGSTGSSPKPAIHAEEFADVYLNNNLNFAGAANTYEFVSVIKTHGDTYDTVPSTPLKGDMAFVGTKPQWWNGSAWVDATGTAV